MFDDADLTFDDTVDSEAELISYDQRGLFLC